MVTTNLKRADVWALKEVWSIWKLSSERFDLDCIKICHILADVLIAANHTDFVILCKHVLIYVIMTEVDLEEISAPSIDGNYRHKVRACQFVRYDLIKLVIVLLWWLVVIWEQEEPNEHAHHVDTKKDVQWQAATAANRSSENFTLLVGHLGWGTHRVITS